MQIDNQLCEIGLSSTEISRFKELMNAAVAHRRAHWEKLSPADQEYWALDMAELARDVGIDRLYAGLRKAWTWNKFLASAAEVRECVPPVPDVVKPRATHDTACPDCSGSGWKFVTRYSEFYRRDERRATRCDCNTRPHRPRKAADAADAAYIAAKVAELDAAFRMRPQRRPYQPKAASSPSPVIPIVAFTAEQIQRRIPMEREEILRCEKQG